MKRSVLPNVRVASPCNADWNAMTLLDAEGRARHCASCDKNVYNLSSMTRADAEALIIAKEGKLCVRFYQRKDGTILLADCTVGASNAKKRKLIAAGAVALLAGSGALTLLPHQHTRDVSAATIEQSTVEEVRPDERALPEVAHDDPPPPAPPPEPVAVPDDEWQHTAGIMIMDHDENPI